jgi:hypothetical protein
MSDPVAWTFATGGTVTEQLTWLTDVLQATTGPSQHRRLRTAPRTVFKFDGLETGRRRRWLEALLVSNGAGQWQAPLVMEAGALASDLSAASDTIDIDTTTRRFVADGHALLMGEDPQAFELVQIDSIAAGALTLVDDTVNAWPAGTRVFPVRRARLEGMPSLSRFTGDASPYQVQFRLEEPLEFTPNFGTASYRGLPVVEWQPVWTADPEWTPERQLSTEDEQTGNAEVFDLVGIPLGKQVMQCAAQGAAQIAAFRGLLFALCGRWSVAWVPSWTQDLRITAAVANGATTLDVEGPALSPWPLQVNRRDIRIQLHDGTVLYRRVTAAVAHTATVDRLTLDGAIAIGFAASAVASVSFMALSRQDTDVNLLRYWNHDTLQSELTFRAVASDV